MSKSNSRGPQQLNDHVVQNRVHRERDQFIASISEDEVLRLASSHHNGEACSFFTPAASSSHKARGSYNICYFVQFHSSRDKWVVRVPLQPCLGFSVKSKLDSEVATMRLLAEKTTIPVPKLHAYAADDGASPLATYMILEYIDGEKLSHPRIRNLSDEQKNNLYSSLADIYIQLRRLEFSSIGRLVHRVDGVQVGTKIMSIDINMQELEGLGPSNIQESYYNDTGTLTSANDYVTMLLDIANNAFLKGRNSVVEKGMGADALYHQYEFRKCVKEKWVDRNLDQGPFVLVHGDLEPFNLMVDKNMTIIAILDWEWSRVVPIQLFKPPLWLTCLGTTTLALQIVYDDYLENAFGNFHGIVRARERERFGNELLADEWARFKDDGGFLIANALENWTDIDWVANKYINWRWYDGPRDLDERIEAYIQEDPLRAYMAEVKESDGLAYMDELNRAKETNLVRDVEKQEDATQWVVISTPFSWLGRAIPGSTLVKAAVIAGTSYLIASRLAGSPFPPKT